MNKISYDDDSASMVNESSRFIKKINEEQDECIVENKVYDVKETAFNGGQSPKVMKRVLLADDSRFMRGYIKTILKKNGYSVVAEAVDGQDAIDLYNKYKPDMVILDITMPNKNGLEALKEIKQSDSNAKVLVCSSMGQKFYMDEAYKLGAIDYIIKPFKIESVVAAVKKILP